MPWAPLMYWDFNLNHIFRLTHLLLHQCLLEAPLKARNMRSIACQSLVSMQLVDYVLHKDNPSVRKRKNRDCFHNSKKSIITICVFNEWLPQGTKNALDFCVERRHEFLTLQKHCHILGPYTRLHPSLFAWVHQKLLEWPPQPFFCAVKKIQKNFVTCTMLFSVVTNLTIKAIWSIMRYASNCHTWPQSYLAPRTSWRMIVFTFLPRSKISSFWIVGER